MAIQQPLIDPRFHQWIFLVRLGLFHNAAQFESVASLDRFEQVSRRSAEGVIRIATEIVKRQHRDDEVERFLAFELRRRSSLHRAHTGATGMVRVTCVAAAITRAQVASALRVLSARATLRGVTIFYLLDGAA
jgi:hypothetical protein